MHLALVHVSVGAHTMPQPPQFFGSVVMSAQPVAQHESPPVHAGPPLQVGVHMLLTQFEAVGHAMPQPPQFFGSFVVFAQPVLQHCCMPLHAGPPLHVAVQMPPMQFVPAGHLFPQKPQFCESLLVVLHPDAQHVCPGMHVGPPLQPVMHLPPVQTPPQSFWQPPQFFGSFSRFAQPLAQHERLGGHIGPPLHVSVHMPPMQPEPGGHVMPQPPQLLGSLVVSEQPDMQHENPGGHGPPLQPETHIELMHWPPGGHAMSQPPQLFGSLVGSTQTLLQRIWTPGQTCLPQVLPEQQAPPMHDVVPGGHVSPQPPQLFRSLLVSTHVDPQHVKPGEQPICWQFIVFGLHTPAMHAAFGPHALPQKPQLLGSVTRFVSQPSKTWLSQLAKPGSQNAMAQANCTQSVDPCGTGPQASPHAPQLALSELKFAHVMPQHVRFGGQTCEGPQEPTQVPPEQESPGGQALPHPPQFFGSLPVLVSQPSATTWLQSPKPGEHPRSAQPPPLHVGTACGKGPHVLPQPPQSEGSVLVSTHRGLQQVRPFMHAPPPPQNPTQWKLEHSSPLGHWELFTHSTQVCVSSRQCGVGAAQSASDMHPPTIGTHMCVVGSHCSPWGQSAFV
jgi:hypothetical protein